ncbi:hypothetical protein LINPERPRIM_LOCUS41171 [Linum perenne]
MNQLNKVWMAPNVAVVQGPHPDQGTKWRSDSQSLHHGKHQFFFGVRSKFVTSDSNSFMSIQIQNQ